LGTIRFSGTERVFRDAQAIAAIVSGKLQVRAGTPEPPPLPDDISAWRTKDMRNANDDQLLRADAAEQAKLRGRYGPLARAELKS
jgi:hypothetical protein